MLIAKKNVSLCDVRGSDIFLVYVILLASTTIN